MAEARESNEKETRLNKARKLLTQLEERLWLLKFSFFDEEGENCTRHTFSKDFKDVIEHNVSSERGSLTKFFTGPSQQKKKPSRKAQGDGSELHGSFGIFLNIFLATTDINHDFRARFVDSISALEAGHLFMRVLFNVMEVHQYRYTQYETAHFFSKTCLTNSQRNLTEQKKMECFLKDLRNSVCKTPFPNDKLFVPQKKLNLHRLENQAFKNLQFLPQHFWSRKKPMVFLSCLLKYISTEKSDNEWWHEDVGPVVTSISEAINLYKKTSEDLKHIAKEPLHCFNELSKIGQEIYNGTKQKQRSLFWESIHGLRKARADNFEKSLTTFKRKFPTEIAALKKFASFFDNGTSSHRDVIDTAGQMLRLYTDICQEENQLEKMIFWRNRSSEYLAMNKEKLDSAYQSLQIALKQVDKTWRALTSQVEVPRSLGEDMMGWNSQNSAFVPSEDKKAEYVPFVLSEEKKIDYVHVSRVMQLKNHYDEKLVKYQINMSSLLNANSTFSGHEQTEDSHTPKRQRIK